MYVRATSAHSCPGEVRPYVNAGRLVANPSFAPVPGIGIGRRFATALAFLLPAGVCFTTIGRLWYLPGLLLLAAGVLVLVASSRDELVGAVDQRRWLSGLVAVLGGYYVFLGADALPKAIGMLGILGGLAIWAALLATRISHRATLGLLAAGTLPFAIVTWWSVVTPLIAILILALGPAAIRLGRASHAT